MKHWDIAVIGAGPAGMMAAGRAARCGARVLVLEKNQQPGRKLLITGKGRCNITHAPENQAEPAGNDRESLQAFVEVFGKKNKGRFLLSALEHFSVADTLAFFNRMGLKTKIERGNRVFPVSDKAADVLAVLLRYMKESGVTVKTNAPVAGFSLDGGLITGLRMQDPEAPVRADKYILCTGGLSYPGTGSSGDGFEWCRQLGHKVIATEPALVPIRVREKWIGELQGLSLKNCRIAVYFDNKKRQEAFGEALFTHDGVSGPIILDLSRAVSECLPKGPVHLEIDFKPALTFQQLDNRIQRDFSRFQGKMFKNGLDKLLPKTLIPVVIQLSGIDPQKKVNGITREERKRLIHLLKEMRVTVRSLYGYEKAIVTAGGVALKEIEARTMRSRLFANLYFAGEVLDLDGPTGGYNLQVCWSTGYLAGESAAKA